jgi:F-type H+-transporting ATPase subunit delta
MAGEKTTIARPYAEAVFSRASESDSLSRWSEMLDLLAAVVQDPRVADLIDNPDVSRGRSSEMLLALCADQLTEEGRNLVRILADNGRLTVLPEIHGLFEELHAESQGTLDVHITSAYVVTAAQEKELAQALRAKLGREVRITSEKDPDLIAGVIIRAGDLVIDGSFKGQLENLATDLGI